MNFKLSDYLLMIGMGLVFTILFSVGLNQAFNYSLVKLFGYENFDRNNVEMVQLVGLMMVVIIFASFMISAIHKVLKPYFIALGTVLTVSIALTGFIIKDVSLEQHAYNQSLKQFEKEYLFKTGTNEFNLSASHPDIVAFYAHKDNASLTEQDRRAYFSTLEQQSNAMKKLSRYTTVYNLGDYAHYFMNKTDSDRFFMSYANIKDPELKLMIDKIMKEPLVTTLDYAQFNSLYRKKFVDKHYQDVTAYTSLMTTSHDKSQRNAIDIQSVSALIDFFEQHNVEKLSSVKKEFVSLLAQPYVSKGDIQKVRGDITNIIRSDSQLYSLMSQL